MEVHRTGGFPFQTVRSQSLRTSKLFHFHLLEKKLLFFLVGFKGNVSLVDFFFVRGLKQIDVHVCESGHRFLGASIRLICQY